MSLLKTGMMDEIPIIRFRGIFSWRGLYQFMREWFERNNYNFNEKKYKHKGDEVEVEMLGEKKIDAMYKEYVTIAIHIWDLKEVEVEEEGKKVKKNYGKFELTIDGSIEVDYSGRFSEPKSKLGKKLGEWWFKITKKDFEIKVADPFYYELYNLHEKLKKYLKMEMDSGAY